MTLQSLLRTRIDVETSTVSQSQGARKLAWTTKYSQLPARVEPLSVSTALRFKRDGMEVSHKVYVGSPGQGPVNSIAITQGERVKFGTRYFQIEGVRNPDERNTYLVLHVKELRP